MMKNILILLLCMPIIIMGQISVNQGKIQKIKKSAWAGASNDIEKLIGSDESGVYVMRHEVNFKSSFFHVEKYNKNTFELIYTTNLDIDKQANIKEIGYGFVLADKKIHFYFESFSKTKTMILYEKIVDDKGVLSDTKELEEFPYQGNVNFIVKPSPDGTTALIVWNDKWHTKDTQGQKNKASLYKLKDQSKVWSKEIPETYNNAPIVNPECIVDNKGNLVCFFGYKKGDLQQAAIGFFAATASTAKFADIKADPSERIMAVQMNFYANKLNGAFTTYSSKGSGVCSFSADASKAEVLNSDFKAFTSDLAKNLSYVTGPYNPGEKLYEATCMEEINGNYYYIIEYSTANSQSLGGFVKQDLSTGKTTDMGGSTSFSDYIRRNIVITKINSASSKIDWMQVLPKFVVNSQGGHDIKLDDINGTLFISADNKIYLLYLENPDIEKDIAKGKKFTLDRMNYVNKASNDANVVCYEIDENKNVKRSIVYTNNDIDARPFAKNDHVILEKGKSILVYFFQGKSECLGSFTIK